MAWFFCALFSLAGGMCLCPFFVDGCMEAEVVCIECNALKRIDDAGWVP